MEASTIIAILNSSFIVAAFAFCAPKICDCLNRISQCFGLDNSGTDAAQPTGGQTDIGTSLLGEQTDVDPSQGDQTVAGPSRGCQTEAGPSQGGQNSGEIMFLVPELEIENIDNWESWERKDLPNEPRFKKVAMLKYDTWLEIKATIKLSQLSPNTNYAAFLIFKTKDNSQGLGLIQDTYVIVGKNKYLSRNKVCLKPSDDRPHKPNESPKKRSDGWMELKLDQFNSDAVSGYSEVVIKIKEIDDNRQKTGLIVAGMEIRPI